MNNSDMSPKTLLSVPNDFEAAMIVSALAAHGIDASTSGSFTAGMRAEAPGDVEVLVRSGDLAQAREALQEIQTEATVDESSDVNLPLELPSDIRGKVILLMLFLCLLFAIVQFFF